MEIASVRETACGIVNGNGRPISRPLVQRLLRLRKRFPDGNIDHHPSDGQVFITLPLKDRSESRVGLSWQQAKVLAYSQLTGDGLKDGDLPPDWPPS